jgi:acyl CoA:acetate/3-ketoacid CoA transferase
MDRITMVFDVPSHIESEFGKCVNSILSEMDQLLYSEKISQKEKDRIRMVTLRNLNNLKRNFIMLIEAINARNVSGNH